MKTRAAIAWAPNQPLEIEEIDLEGPKEGEVLARIVTTSLCNNGASSFSGESIRSVIHFQPDQTMTVNSLPGQIVPD